MSMWVSDDLATEWANAGRGCLLPVALPLLRRGNGHRGAKPSALVLTKLRVARGTTVCTEPNPSGPRVC